MVVIIEAIDPVSSNTFQARHSYNASDIVFDETFLPAMTIGGDGRAKIDWDNFHKTTQVPFNVRQIVGGSHS